MEQITIEENPAGKIGRFLCLEHRPVFDISHNTWTPAVEAARYLQTKGLTHQLAYFLMGLYLACVARSHDQENAEPLPEPAPVVVEFDPRAAGAEDGK